MPRRAPNPAPERPLGGRRALLGIASAVAGLTAGAADPAVDPSRLPPPAARPIDFAADIQPILERACLRCHGPERPKAGFRLDNRDSALAGGDGGVVIQVGDSAGSALIHYVARLVPDMEMPPEGKGDPLTAAEVGLMRAWIDQGAAWSTAADVPRVSFVVEPSVRFLSVSGNQARFREHTWLREGWGGGLSEYSLKYDVDPRTRVELDGRALGGDEDYRFSARAERDGLGWARLAYREFTRYQDDTGGYYAPFATAAPRLGDDLLIRHRQATAQFALELPDWPSLQLSYDLHLRDGTESTLHWGGVTVGSETRNIHPGRKRVEETTHTLTLDVRYDWDGLRVSDHAQIEWHDQDNLRTDTLLAGPPDTYNAVVTDRQDLWRGANVLRLERSVRDWLHLSGGYLYSQLEDAGGYSVVTLSPTDPAFPPSTDLAADDLTLRRRSNVVNANAMLGPWEQLHFYAGLQAEWTRQEGFAAGQTYGLPASYDANVDRSATDETFGLRYAGLPATVLFAETRFQQESYSHFEEGLTDADQTFLRDTDATGDLKDYEAGFTVSPWRRVSFETRYRLRFRASDYDHLNKIDLFSSGNGYPAFIRERDTDSDEVELRVVVQPLRWLKTTARYTLGWTDFETLTDSWTAGDPPVTYPGGRLESGEYEAQSVSAGFVITPWSRLHLAPTLSWVTSRSESAISDGTVVAPYEGESWNLFTTATYVVDEKTDLFASQLYSHGDYGQDNEAFGLPLGIRYTRNAVTTGITRRMKRNRLLRLEYAYYNYDEPTLGGAADYTAHGVFASYRMSWP